MSTITKVFLANESWNLSKKVLFAAKGVSLWAPCLSIPDTKCVLQDSTFPRSQRAPQETPAAPFLNVDSREAQYGHTEKRLWFRRIQCHLKTLELHEPK